MFSSVPIGNWLEGVPLSVLNSAVLVEAQKRPQSLGIDLPAQT
jgi:hypothetical protein